MEETKKIDEEMAILSGRMQLGEKEMDEIRKKRANKCTDDHKMAFLASVTVAALNGLDVQEGADVQNVRLNASNGERVWMRARPEFGDDEEKYLIVV
eukprot:scaffold6752_cov89-Cylindrotheca_fusiformis.AAC.3